MRKISILALSVFLLNIIFSTFSVALSTSKESIISDRQRAIAAMKAWKEKKRELIKEIYEQTNISSLMDLADAAKQLNDVSNKLKILSTSYKTIKLQKKSIDKKYMTVLKDARKLVIKLNKKSKQLKDILVKLQVLSKDLQNIKQQIKAIKDTIFISKEEIKKYVIVLYKMNNDYYSSFWQLDDLKLLIKSSNIAKSLSNEDIIKILSLKTQQLLDKLNKSEQIKKKFLRKMYLTKAKYIDLVKEYNIQLKYLKEKRKFLVDLLTMLRTNKQEIDKLYDRLYKRRLSLKRQQLKIAHNMKSVLSWNEIKAKPIDLSEILKYTIKTDWDKFFNWPTRDYHDISAYFHDNNYFKKFWFEHDWIDIKVPQWTNIYAPAAGYVYKVVDNTWDYYNYIVLVHNYWYVSIYGHISKSLVKEGQIVKRWQIIAKSGWTPWTRWAWKFSTWPHLHFEVRKNWQLIDPLSVLDLSVYTDKTKIPSEWQIKYLKDKITRKVDLSSVKFYPKNWPEKKRIEIFLRTKAAPEFRNTTWWIQLWKKFGIDPAVAVCIGYAESWLWWNTTTKYNVGNVWNNDRWDRRGFSTPLAGIAAIYYVLNNKYLSKYYTIYSLSRYWNKDSHIYSSSTFNWYKNVLKCLAKIKWYPPDEYYPFRIR